MFNNYRYWNLSDNTADCIQKITVLNSQVTSLNSQVTSLNSQVTSLQNIIDQIDYKSMQDKITKLEADVKKLQESSGG